MAPPDPAATDLRALAAEAYIYGYPLVINLTQVLRFTTEGLGAMPPADFNTFAHATTLAGPRDTFVSVNNDTIYSVAQLDLAAGPVRLDVPDTGGRYYVLQFVDAWTNNFAYVGRRATGTAAGSFWIVGPGHTDPLPNGAQVIHAPTAVATIVGRWAVEGEADVPVVRALQQELRLSPLNGRADGPGVPTVEHADDESLAFFARLAAWSEAFPPAAAEREYAERLAPVLDDAAPADDERRAALRDGFAAGQERLEQAIASSGAPEQHGWQLTYHIFDYNNDFFEIGALDDAQWRIADRQAARVIRAAAARAGLWGNHGYEAAYAMTYVDGDGEALTGERAYTIHFTQPPPVDAFWSITMYDLPDFYLVDNPIDRYSIGDRTPGLRTDDDGGLTVVLAHKEPDRDERANWLPAPPGAFRPILRLYMPLPAVFDGSYVLPPVVRRA